MGRNEELLSHDYNEFAGSRAEQLLFEEVEARGRKARQEMRNVGGSYVKYFTTAQSWDSCQHLARVMWQSEVLGRPLAHAACNRAVHDPTLKVYALAKVTEEAADHNLM